MKKIGSAIKENAVGSFLDDYSEDVVEFGWCAHLQREDLQR